MITMFKAQGFNQVFVEFSELEIRGVKHKGRAWFTIVRGVDEKILHVKGLQPHRRDWLTSSRADKIFEYSSKAALDKIEGLLLAAALEWVNKNPQELVEAERKNLQDIVDRQLQAKNDAHQLLMGLEKELSAARVARARFERDHPAEVPQRVAKKVGR